MNKNNDCIYFSMGMAYGFHFLFVLFWQMTEMDIHRGRGTIDCALDSTQKFYC